LKKYKVQEIHEALEAFRAGVEAGDMIGFKPGSMRAH
jgi:hypothetical protein